MVPRDLEVHCTRIVTSILSPGKSIPFHVVVYHYLTCIQILFRLGQGEFLSLAYL